VEKAARVLPYLEKAGLAPAKLPAIVQAAQDRIKVAGDILDYASFFQPDDRFCYDEAAFDKHIRKPPEAAGLLRKLRERLATVEPYEVPTLERLVLDFVQAEGIELKQIIHALRVALTGKAVWFGLYDSLAILGRQSCLARIERTLERNHVKN